MCHFTSPAMFNHQPYDHWYDPENWRGPGLNPIPHMERIPCRYDSAIFPKEMAYKVSISKQPVEISFMKINNIYVDSGRHCPLFCLKTFVPRVFQRTLKNNLVLHSGSNGEKNRKKPLFFERIHPKV